jgi:hypothetical protein
LSESLDEYLRAVVATLYTAVDTGMKNVADAPEVTDKVIADCDEILDVIMAGDVKEWVGAD